MRFLLRRPQASEAKRGYDDFIVGDHEALGGPDFSGEADLVVSADVMIYIGELAPFFQARASELRHCSAAGPCPRAGRPPAPSRRGLPRQWTLSRHSAAIRLAALSPPRSQPQRRNPH